VGERITKRRTCGGGRRHSDYIRGRLIKRKEIYGGRGKVFVFKAAGKETSRGNWSEVKATKKKKSAVNLRLNQRREKKKKERAQKEYLPD